MRTSPLRVVVVALLLGAPLSARAVPRLLGYEGRLVEDGSPATGTPAVTFRIYDVAEGGEALWTEPQTLALTDGFYATYLGAVTELPVALFDGSDRYLELTVGQEVLAPRQRIGASAYAIRSEVARSVSGGTVDATSLAVNGLTVVDGAGRLAGPAAYSAGPGVVIDSTNGRISLLDGCGEGQLLKWNGAGWACADDVDSGGTVTAVSVAAGSPLLVTDGSTTPELSITQASSGSAGYLSAEDWSTFDAKVGPATSAGGDLVGAFGALEIASLQGNPVSALHPADGQALTWNGLEWAPVTPTGGTVTALSASGPLTVVDGTSTPALSISRADAVTDGYLAAADWSTFSAKVGPQSSAGGDVSGTFGALVVTGLRGDPLSSEAPAAGEVLKWDGAAWSPSTDVNSGGTVTRVTVDGATPLSVVAGSTEPLLSISRATPTTAGYLAPTDFAAFSEKFGPGSTVGVANGGTGAASLPANGVLLGNGVGAVTSVAGLGTAGQVLTSGGAGAAPAWSAPTQDARLVRGVPVDDRAKDDGFVLRYDAASSSLVYANLTYGGPPPPVVQASVVWSAASSGSAACAVVKGVCTQAANGSGAAQSCAASSTTGSATCAASNGVNASANWTSASSGHAACTAQSANCVQAYDAAGNAVACNSVTSVGVAACLVTTAAQGWDTFASWTSNVLNGFMVCVSQSGDCVGAFDASGTAVACTNFMSAGRARCLRKQTGDALWDKGATWSGATNTGDVSCALQQAECVDVTHGGTGTGTCLCGSNCGGGGYTMVARCKSIVPATHAWDRIATWTGTTYSGDVRCALQNADCVSVHHDGTGGGTCACGANCGGAGYRMVARCKTRAASVWDSVVTWPGSTMSGTVQCAVRNSANCVSVAYDGPSAGGCSCTQICSTSGYTMLARCKSRAADESWDKAVTWPGTATSGNVECAKASAECLDVHYDGPSAGGCSCGQLCQTAGYTMMARCRTATNAASGWNTPVQWTGLASTGTAQCAAIGATCAGAIDATSGASRTCADSITTGVAKCSK